MKRLKVAFALTIIFEGENARLVKGASAIASEAHEHLPLAMATASGAPMRAPTYEVVTYLEDGDFVVLTRRSAEVIDGQGCQVVRPISYAQASAFLADKGKHKHFMAKEIAEQREVVGYTLAEHVEFWKPHGKAVNLPTALRFDFAQLDKLTISRARLAPMASYSSSAPLPARRE